MAKKLSSSRKVKSHKPKTTPKQAVIKVVKSWEHASDEAHDASVNGRRTGNIRPHVKKANRGAGIGASSRKRRGGFSMSGMDEIGHPEKAAKRAATVKKYGTLIVRVHKSIDRAKKLGRNPPRPTSKQLSKASGKMRAASSRAKSRKK